MIANMNTQVGNATGHVISGPQIYLPIHLDRVPLDPVQPELEDQMGISTSVHGQQSRTRHSQPATGFGVHQGSSAFLGATTADILVDERSKHEVELVLSAIDGRRQPPVRLHQINLRLGHQGQARSAAGKGQVVGPSWAGPSEPAEDALAVLAQVLCRSVHMLAFSGLAPATSSKPLSGEDDASRRPIRFAAFHKKKNKGGR